MSDDEVSPDSEATGEGEGDGDENRPDSEATGDRSNHEDHTNPLSELSRGVRERRRRKEREPDAFAAFDRGPLADLDDEELWTELSADPDVSMAESTADGRDVRVVAKRVCHGCPHFAAPPDVRCTHEGTEIRRLEDLDHFRVVDCPVVAEESSESVNRGRHR